MTVRRRILFFQLVTIGFVALVIGMMLTTLRLTGNFVRRIDGVHSRFEAISDLDGLGNNYAEQLAEVLLLGPEQMPDFELAKRKMEDGFRRLTEVTRREFTTLGGLGDVQQELPEVEFSARLHEFYRAIDRAAVRVFRAKADGRQELAVDIFRRNIEYRLANDFEAMVEGARQEERGEVGEELGRVQHSQQALLIAVAACSVLVVAAGVGSGLALQRSIVQPVRRLAAGAEAIAQGRLDHRILSSRHDEFQLLSDSFNRMAEAIEEQQGWLIAAQGRLESEVGQRTRELREANEQLRALDSRRSQFLTDAGHELRTPLTILRGEAEVALRGRPKLAAYRDALTRIGTYAADMARLLEDLQAFTRAQTEDVSFTFEAVEPEAAVASAIRESAILAGPKQMAIRLVETAPGCMVRADPQRLKQALLIGIDNAIKYADAGGIVEIGIRGETGSVVISIGDHGCGIDPAELPFVFDRYYRGRNNASRAAKGLGVGLSIARNIVERHGGAIALEAAEPRGAVLRIRLPVMERLVDAHPDH